MKEGKKEEGQEGGRNAYTAATKMTLRKNQAEKEGGRKEGRKGRGDLAGVLAQPSPKEGRREGKEGRRKEGRRR